MEWIKNNKNPTGLIIWTGDSISHAFYTESVDRDSRIDILRNLTETLLENFPNTPIYPSLGNHDFFPDNIQDMRESSSDYLAELAILWEPLIGADAAAQFSKFGYYSINNPKRSKNGGILEGVTLISLNT